MGHAELDDPLAGDTGPLTTSWRPIDAGGNAAATLAKAREVLARVPEVLSL
jgi:hypothetical protein